ncbi:putative nuclease HARBI1 [Orchesella cincta]|uniref:Putative nuclease HARBI1 n=1 Tax=Orchesella cincta TaxID=48709 RepID=A0A1D2M1U0_ORCCI|nr:putative nuclease HARBI1 [Orchesella cincta]
MSSQLVQGTINAAFTAAVAAIKYNSDRILVLNAEEESDLQLVAHLQSIMAVGHGTNEKTIWKFPTSDDWWKTIYPNLPDEVFIQHFRVDRIAFKWIVNEVKELMDTKFRNAIEVERKVAASLKCLATTCDFLTVAALFGIGKSSVHKYFTKFVDAVYQKVVPKVIQFPNEDEIRKSATEFEQMWGFPMAFAAIDGTHIPFNPPVHLASDFHNYKGWSSIIAVAMCDAHGKAIWLQSGLPGRLSDSGAFKATRCYAALTSGKLIPSGKQKYGDTEVPYVVLGDSGFAMESWLLKPFTYHGSLVESQKIFNYRHSRARRAVENMFGRVKLRWRRLLRGLDVHYQNAHKVISVAFALHNICESQGIGIHQTAEELIENMELDSRRPQPTSMSAAEAASGIMCRNALMNYFVSQPNPWSGK